MRALKFLVAPLLAIALLSGCAGGPTKDYYNPTRTDAKFVGPATISLVPDVEAEKQKLLAEGYVEVGRTTYVGKYPESVELTTQAKRVHANHVIYSTERVSAKEGSLSFGMVAGHGWFGPAQDQTGVRIIFLGK